MYIEEPFHSWPKTESPNDTASSRPDTSTTQQPSVTQADSWNDAWAAADSGSLSSSSGGGHPGAGSPPTPTSAEDQVIIDETFGDADVGQPQVVENFSYDDGTYFRYDIYDAPIQTVPNNFLFDGESEFNNAANAHPDNAALTFEGVTYETDDRGRIALVYGTPEWNERARSSEQTEIGHQGDDFDVGFHVLMHNAGTPTNELTVVPGNGFPIVGDPDSNLNQGDYANQYERQLRAMQEQNPEVEIRVNYHPDNDTIRPDSFAPLFRGPGNDVFSPGNIDDSYYGADGGAFDNKTVENRFYDDPYASAGPVADTTGGNDASPFIGPVVQAPSVFAVPEMGPALPSTGSFGLPSFNTNAPATVDNNIDGPADDRVDNVVATEDSDSDRGRTNIDANASGILYQAEAERSGTVAEARYEGEHGSAAIRGPGYEVNGEASLTIDDGRINANAEASAEVYLANVEFEASYGPASVNAEAYVGASAEIETSINFDPLNGDIAAQAGGEVFVGGKAEAEATVSISDNADIGVGGGVSYGIGAEFEAKAGFEDGTLDFEFDAGATLGLGVDLSFDVEVDVFETASDIGNGIKDIGGAIGGLFG